MKVMFSSRIIMLLAGSLLCSSAITVQTSAQSIQLIPEVNVRNSTATSYDNLVTFSSSTVYLSCPTSGITATLSGPQMNGDNTGPATDTSGNLQPGGNLLVDNALLVTVTPQGGSANPTVNACVNAAGAYQSGSYNGKLIPTSPVDLTWSCFNLGGYGYYAGTLANTSLYPNPNPDTTIVPGGTQTVDYAGGVPPIDISKKLVSGQQSLQLSLVDGGGQLASSTIFLTTNCSILGIGAGTLSGNPINSSQNQGTGQTFTFNSNTAGLKGIQFGYDVTGALKANSLSNNTDGSVPQVADVPVDPSTFQSTYVPGTSFATSNCLVHNGEVLNNGTSTMPACKLYTLQCSLNQQSPSGAQCPVSNKVNEIISELFDGPQFQLYDIHNKSGGVIHEGIGFLMASDTWPGTGTDPTLTNCQFEVESGLSAAPCPLNLLTSFTGPGAFSGNGQTTNPNSEFISVYGVPLDKTIVTVTGEKSGNWVNTGTPTIKFDVQAPNLTSSTNGYPYIVVNGIKTSVPGASSYIPQPIKNVSYGITTAAAVPNPVNEPIAGDVTLGNASPTYVGCAQGPLSSQTQPDLITSDTVSSGSALSDGQYLLHYYAQDCAGTQELNFTMAPGTGVWSTSFFTRPLNVDTTKPQVNVISPTGTPSYAKNSTAYVSYSCTDAGYVQGGPNTGSGVVKCGSYNFGVGSTFNTNVLTTKLNTSTTGSKSYVIYAIDGAGNQTSATVYYNVN